MSSETKLHLAEKFRQNWQSQYPYLGRNDYRTLQPNILKHINRDMITTEPDYSSHNSGLIDDSLTNLNWLQNLNFFSMPQCTAPLSPSPTNYFLTPSPIMTPTVGAPPQPSRLAHPFYETNALYAEVAQNLEFINEEASAHFFKVNNQLRPPFSDINLISMAIYSCNKNKISFPEICRWIEETFPYYKIISQDWKVGIKNHLTLSKCFQKVPRRKEENEKGGFWRFSNDFLNYLEKNRLLGRNFNEILINAQQENEAQIDYKYGKFLPRKRTIASSGQQDENRNLSFKIPNKKQTLCDSRLLVGLDGYDQLIERSEVAMHQFCHSLRKNPMVTACSSDLAGGLSLLTACSNASQLTHLFEVPKFEHGSYQNQLMGPQNVQGAPMSHQPPCPEQLTEEEFLSGRVFSQGYATSSQATLENLPTLLDTQVNFNSSDFNISNLSVTGVGIRPPEWWGQSLSASQLSISKLGCSLRSLASVGNLDRGASPFNDDDQHVVWHHDQNLEELDILFGLS